MMLEQISNGQRAIIFTDRLDQAICDADGTLQYARSHIGSIDAILTSLTDLPALAPYRDSSEWTALSSLVEFAKTRAWEAQRAISIITEEMCEVAHVEVPGSPLPGRDEWDSAVKRYEQAEAARNAYNLAVEEPARAKIEKIDGSKEGAPFDRTRPMGHAASAIEREEWRHICRESDRLGDLSYDALQALVHLPAPDLSAYGYKCALMFRDGSEAGEWMPALQADAVRLRQSPSGDGLSL